MRRQFEIDGEQDRGLAGREIGIMVPHQIEMDLPPQLERLRRPDLQGHERVQIVTDPYHIAVALPRNRLCRSALTAVEASA
ncbi:hypothetical protein D9M70_616170 [compost metagenome]